MSWKLLKDRLLKSARAGTASFVLPSVILEIEPDFVASARLEGSGRSPRKLKRMGVFAIESGCFSPSASHPNVLNEGEFRRAVREAAEFVGNGNSRYGLLIPDASVRVGILKFETLPDHGREREALIRWRMKEILPFAAEEARLSYQVLGREEGQIEVLALAAKNSILAEYESALEPMNSGALLILPATMALLPFLHTQEGEGQLLVHVCSGWLTTAVVAGERLRLWRTRELGQPGAEDLVRQVAEEAARVLASCRDHMRLEVGRVLLCARPRGLPDLVSETARALAREVELLEPSPELGAALPDDQRNQFEGAGATISGIVANAAGNR